MKTRINAYIDEQKDAIIKSLTDLIEMPSADEGQTKAQEYVSRQLSSLGFNVDEFKGVDERCLALKDYCPPEIKYHENCYNVAGVLKGKSEKPSVMLFAHIDTEREDYFGNFDNPYSCQRKDGKIYGLGSSDDKGGIAMMLEAVKAVHHFVPELDYDLTVMSILGKHGGAFGTLSALMKGYRGDRCVYLHPAETGHGFAEIKNISLGCVDLDLVAKGKPGVMHDDLDPGLNSNVLMMKMLGDLEEYNQRKRRQNVFDFGTFKGMPSFVLNVGSIKSDSGYGGVSLNTVAKIRCRFYFPDSIDSIYSEISELLDKKYRGLFELNIGSFRASPAIVENDDPFVRTIEKSISEVVGITQFIHQYHGGSDIRLPIIYGNSKCVGIGPSCILPPSGSNQLEWIDEKDYINGVKILANLLISLNEE